MAQLTTYDRISRANHWLVALLMIGMIVFGFYLFRVMPRGPGKGELIGIHKAIGLVILGLGSWRVYWRLRQGFVASLQTGWQDRLAHVIHIVLLVAIVIMPASGLMGSFFGGREIGFFDLFTVPAGPKIEWLSSAAYWIHGTGAFAVAGAVLLHVAGALKHHFLDRDATVARMIGRG